MEDFMLNLNLKKTLLTFSFLTFLTTFYGFEAREADTEFMPLERAEMASRVATADFALLEEGDFQISAYDNLFRHISQEQGTDWRLMSAIAYHESRFTADAVSPRGAKGLMQIMPVVARQFNVPQEEVLNPQTNVLLANLLLNKIDKTLRLPAATPSRDRLSLILAAYNGGIGHVSDARRLARLYGENPNSWEVVSRYLELKSDPAYYSLEQVKSGRFTGYRQTRAYVEGVLAKYHQYCKSTLL